MARRKKRASMREGPLADLFRSTEESVAPEEVKVTATDQRRPSRGRGARPGDAAVPSRSRSRRRSRSPSPRPTRSRSRCPAQSRCPEPTPPEPVAETRSSIRDPPRGPRAADGRAGHRDAARATAATSLRRDEPPTRQPACRARTRPSSAWSASAAPASTPSTAWSRRELPGVEFIAVNTDLQSLQTSHADVTLHIGDELTRGPRRRRRPRVGYTRRLRGAGQDQGAAQGLRHGLRRRRRRRRHRHRRRPGGRPARPRHRRADRRHRHQAVRLRGRAPRRPGRARASTPSAKEVDTLIVVPNDRLLTILERRPRSSTPSRSPTTSCARGCRASPTWSCCPA